MCFRRAQSSANGPTAIPAASTINTISQPRALRAAGDVERAGCAVRFSALGKQSCGGVIIDPVCYRLVTSLTLRLAQYGHEAELTKHAQEDFPFGRHA